MSLKIQECFQQYRNHCEAYSPELHAQIPYENEVLLHFEGKR